MRRTSVITAAAIAGVVLAGSAAIAANIGILSAADRSKVGTLSATGAITPATTQRVDVYLDDPASTTTVASSGHAADTQEFAVDAAATVSVIQTAVGIHLGDVVANPGWTWSAAQTDASTLKVTFTDGHRTLEFHATVGPDGTIAAAVNEPIVSAAPTRPPGDDGHTHEGRGEDD